jgi:hypothetical protein
MMTELNIIKDLNRSLKQLINEYEALIVLIDEDERIDIRAY